MPSSSPSSREAQMFPDLSRLKALGRPEVELPFDVCISRAPLKPLMDNTPQIIVEVLLSLVLGIAGANFGADSELKDISWRTEMRKRCSPCHPSTNYVLRRITGLSSR